MKEIYSDIDAVVRRKPSTGRELWQNSAIINSIWFRNGLIECDAHDTINLIDSEGEERFSDGNEERFGSPEKFYQLYYDLYQGAVLELLKIVAVMPEEPGSNRLAGSL